MKIKNLLFLSSLLFPLLSLHSFAADDAVNVKVSVDKNSMYIGDRIKYTIAVSSDKEIELKFPSIEDKLGEFVVKDRGISGPNKRGSEIEYSQWAILTIYKTGQQLLPQQIVRYRFREKNEWTSVKTDFVKIEVKSLLAEDPKAKEIRDIKGILRFRNNTIFKIASSILIIAAFIAGIFFLTKRAFSGKKPLPPKPAHAIAYEELERIKMSGLLSEGKVKEYYYRLSYCIRHYLENRFSLRAPEMTLEEFLLTVRDSAVLEDGHKKLLRDFLENSDMVKFAKYNASRGEAQDAFDFAKRFVDETKIEKAGVGDNL